MRVNSNKKALLLISLGFLLSFFGPFLGVGRAQPYGVGAFGANVPYGGQTSLSISTTGNVSMSVSPASGGTASTTSGVTVTSSDVIGYKLYIRAQSSTAMTGANGSIPASANGSPAALAANTWGYNTDNSSNFTGMTLSDALIKTGTGPFTSGDLTNVYYGVKVDYQTAAGSYSNTVVYTAVPQTN
jgi:hypothetical protein